MRNYNKGKLYLDNKVFIPSFIIIIILSTVFALNETGILDTLNNTFNFIVDKFSWGYIWYSVLILLSALFFSFSKYGKVVLGSPSDKPQFTLFEYSSIIIAMGLGSTIMRTGMLQWLPLAMEPPFGIEPVSESAILLGNAYGMFLWSFQTFAIFVMTAPAIGYMLHVRKKPILRMSEVCRCIFGDRFTDGIGGIVIDIIFMVSIVAGAAVTLGLGTPIVTNVIAKMFNMEITYGLTLTITIIWIILFTGSAYLGVEKGIKNLSTLNVYLAAFFGIFIMILGPGIFILDQFTDSIRILMDNYVSFSLYSDSLRTGSAGYMQNYTVFWFAYCATWALLHGVFVAKISKGRTIREMILTYLLAPTALSWVATGVLGGLSINRFTKAGLPLVEIVEQKGLLATIPEILQTLPLPTICFIIFIVLTMIFLTTTLDSTTYTIAAYVSSDDMSKNEPSKPIRIIVALMISALAIILMRTGGLGPLEVLSGLMGLPIIALQFLSVYAAKKMIDEDKAWKYNIRTDEVSIKADNKALTYQSETNVEVEGV